MTEEENKAEKPEEAAAPNLGKFQNVDALMRAYQELEAEFTRRSQRLKALEAAAKQPAQEQGSPATAPETPVAEADSEALLRAVRGNEEVCARIVGEYLASLSGVPLLAGTGAGIVAPVERATTLKQAGALALGYLKHRKNGG